MTSESHGTPGFALHVCQETQPFNSAIATCDYAASAALPYQVSWSGQGAGRARAGRLGGERCEAAAAFVSGLSIGRPGHHGRSELLVIVGYGGAEPSAEGTISLFSDATEFDLRFETPQFVCSVAVPWVGVLADATVLGPLIGAPTTSRLAWTFMRPTLAALTAGAPRVWPASLADAALIDQYVLSLAELILRLLGEELPDTALAEPDPIRARADAIILGNSDDASLSPSRIAARLGVSLRSLNRSYANAGGVAHVLRRRRLEVAAVRLRASRYHSVAEVARLSGFPNAGTFYRAFVAAYGVTPLQYRLEAESPKKPPIDDPNSTPGQ